LGTNAEIFFNRDNLTILLEKPYSFWYGKKGTYMEEKLQHIWAELPLDN
jgi:hypothetical protein